MARLPPWPAGPARGERPDRPFTGYKLAHAVLSADGTRAGFVGLTLGGNRVYGVVADAACVWNHRHAPPRRWCGCGFYCLHELADARALACATENRTAVLLEVAASGRYIRYERGLRYARQRVRAILDAQCTCGRPGTSLADAGSGLVGWRHLAPICDTCAAGRPALTLREFTARLDGRIRMADPFPGLPVTTGLPGSGQSGTGLPSTGLPATGLPGNGLPGTGLSGTGVPSAGQPGRGRAAALGPTAFESAGGAEESPIAVLTAEIALLHARLDDLQSRLDGLSPYNINGVEVCRIYTL